MYPEPLIILFSIFAGMFGAVVGSFLNVCIHRLPTNYLSVVSPGSHCPKCGKFLKWYDNIPVISWILLGGSCRSCRNSISFRYVLVELLTAILFIIYTKYILLTPFTVFLELAKFERFFILAISLYLVANMIIITFIDIAYRIIPDSITYTGIILAPFVSLICPVLHSKMPEVLNPHLSGFMSSILGIIVGGGSLYLVGIIGKIIFKKDAMGFGDVKMMAMVGGFIGWDSALMIFLLACIIGTIAGIFVFIITKDNYLPFGPYLAVSTLIIILFKEKVLYIGLTEWPRFVSRLVGLSY